MMATRNVMANAFQTMLAARILIAEPIRYARIMRVLILTADMASAMIPKRKPARATLNQNIALSRRNAYQRKAAARI
jgi:hypothetical protein